MTIADKVLLAFLVAATFSSYVLVERVTTQGSVVLVEVDGELRYKADLQSDASVIIQGASGKLTLQIREGRVSISEADCPNHICVRTSPKSRSGELIVCAPNKTMIQIVGQTDEKIRAVTG